MICDLFARNVGYWITEVFIKYTTNNNSWKTEKNKKIILLHFLLLGMCSLTPIKNHSYSVMQQDYICF